ncbi:predicted protein [Plenodomus lingam JN3]|uniref:Uncharacterized protein n=1 Tax=Leptosphaeria maculans (strain JN3 / isolate v23.1.3 / race Av1-4-5-6-7-8) TaxID=985895 RepID=M1ZMF0_LEPMJ|nr:predicted protein [Plenodomus lingam JN3]
MHGNLGHEIGYLQFLENTFDVIYLVMRRCDVETRKNSCYLPVW